MIFKSNSIILSAAQQKSLMSLIEFENKQLSLLWRGSRDGFDVESFHKLCDGISDTLTVIKSTTGYIFGGYTSVAWASFGEWKSDTAAFIFTFTNPSNTPLKVKVNAPGTHAVYHEITCGPTFGQGHDLYVSDLSNTNNKSKIFSCSYDLPNEKSGQEGGKFILGGSTHVFQTDEVEVYQII